MRYYIYYQDDKIVGHLATSRPVDSPFAKEVTKDDYEAKFGPVAPEPLSDIDILKEENKLLKAQIKAQGDRADFVEDCIAEMAMVVYGGV